MQNSTNLHGRNPEARLHPKLVFFRWSVADLPAYVRQHMDQQVKCLSQWFEVVVVEGAADYRRVCDLHQPDLAIFESGAYGARRRIKNIQANPDIPKIGFLHADANCPSRTAFLSDMDSYGIETFFSLSVSMGEYTPEIADQLFIWPNAIDPEIYRDYNQHKVIPVLFTGSQAPHYPWRKRVCTVLSQTYPCLISPHFGWSDAKATSRMIHGEGYARMINASWFAPACGTIANDLVRKHFEVPGSKSCLVAQRTPALEAAGYVDMENCVLADESDVVDKLDYLFQHVDQLQKIICAGHELVHKRHTLQQRDQIFQWFRLWKTLRANERIVQLGLFAPLAVVHERSGLKNKHVIGHGVDRVLLRQGDKKLWAEDYGGAEALYMSCLQYTEYIPEVTLRLAFCSLYKGDVETAFDRIIGLLKHSRFKHMALDPDPVEWSYLIVCFLCMGKLDQATKCAQKFPCLSHSQLDFARWVVNVLNGRREQYPEVRKTTPRRSVHQIPHWSINERIMQLYKMLKASKQDDWMETLARTVARSDMSHHWMSLVTVGEHSLPAAPEGVKLHASCKRGLLSQVAMLKRLAKNTVDVMCLRAPQSISYVIKMYSVLRKHIRVSIF